MRERGRNRGRALSLNRFNMKVELEMLQDLDILNMLQLDLVREVAQRKQLKAEVKEEIDGLTLYNKLISILLCTIQ